MSEYRPEINGPIEGQTQPPLEVAVTENGDLTVNGKALTSDVDPEILRRALVEGKDEIMAGLEARRMRVQSSVLGRGAEVTIAPFQVVSLGETYKEVLSSDAQVQAGEHSQQIFTNRDDLKEELVPLWDAVVASGYIPQVRAYGRNRWIDLWAELPQRSVDETE